VLVPVVQVRPVRMSMHERLVQVPLANTACARVAPSWCAAAT
jgi:hypothetical protein